MEQTLVLNSSFEPLKVVSWERAITLWFQGKAEIIEEHDTVIRSVSFTMKMPSVVRLLYFVRLKRRPVVQFTRANIYARDEFTCQYCTSPETPILMADLTWAPASEVQPGEVLVGVDEMPEKGRGRRRKLRKSNVLRSVSFIGQRVRVVTSQGNIVVSRDHRFLVCRRAGSVLEWVAADKLTSGARIKYFVRPWSVQPDTWLAGLLDGEGSLDTKRGRVSVGQNAGPVLSRLRRELTDAGIRYADTPTTAKDGNKCYTLQVCNMADVMQLMGKHRPSRFEPTVDRLLDGRFGLPDESDADVVRVEQMGDGPLIGLTTSTGTLITDGFVSHNCGVQHQPDRLTFDHVVPASQGGRRGWTNIVTACGPCNRRKADKTPEQAGMVLRRKPVRPIVLAPTMKLSFGYRTPAAWRDYLFVNISRD